MPKDISIKELRTKLAEVADRVERGESFRVIRRSKPSFVIMKVDEQNALSDLEWETVVDFTDRGTRTGVPVGDVVKALKQLRR